MLNANQVERLQKIYEEETQALLKRLAARRGALEDLRRQEEFSMLFGARPMPEEARAYADDPSRNVDEFIVVSDSKAWDRNLRRWVAIAFPKMFDVAAARLHHPNIPTVYKAGRHAVSQWVEGRPIEAHRIALDAVLYAHQNGVVHGNLTPDKIVADAHGHVWILGFGMTPGAAPQSDLDALNGMILPRRTDMRP